MNWLNDHDHLILDASYSRDFNKVLSGLPWTVNSVRWTTLPHRELEIPDDPLDDNFWEAFKASPIGGHDFTFLMYSGREPGFACRTHDAVPDLDLLYSGAPGSRYFCGVDMGSEGPVLNFKDFAEYDGNGVIKMSMPPGCASP
ncbi:hypothetical protein [Streptomyces sp. NPDC057325]|uniref:hypothetical protein n=1 Tax=unclassified Streptomyces TaxID=2593676 RepID=UPI0036401BCB